MNHAGDRFISKRTGDSELYNNYDTKSEIFSLSASMNMFDKLGGNSQAV